MADASRHRGLAQDPVIPDVTYPSLPKQASSAAGFVPRGWVLEAQASRRSQPGCHCRSRAGSSPERAQEHRQESGLGENPFDTNPRILAVAFRDGPAGDFVLQLENRTLIPRRTDPVMADPFEGGLAIDRGNLRVNLNLWLSAGGWDMSGMTHTLQYRNGRLELIGYDRSTTNRRSLDTTDVSVNYLSGKMKISTGNSNSDKPAKADLEDLGAPCAAHHRRDWKRPGIRAQAVAHSAAAAPYFGSRRFGSKFFFRSRQQSM